jgi:hypothetical protein
MVSSGKNKPANGLGQMLLPFGPCLVLGAFLDFSFGPAILAWWSLVG